MTNTPDIAKTNPPKKLSVGEVLSEAWKLTGGVKGPILVAGVIFPLLIVIVLGGLTFFLFPPHVRMLPSDTLSVTYSFPNIVSIAVIAFLYWFCLTTAIMLGVRRALGMTVSLKETMAMNLNAIVDIFYLFFAFFLITVFFNIVPHLLPYMFVRILCSIFGVYYVLPIELFALPLVILGLQPMKEALITSIRLMNKYFIPIFICYFAMTILSSLSAIPLAIGLIWTVPMHFIMYGLIFKKTVMDAKLAEPTPVKIETPPELDQEESNYSPPEA
ncbi:MAG: hypothetical protein P4M14_09235 [Gammaproteobacteria bacterium]|nr:hypothetical protein [Gammaproteobacteria bacterium]